MDLSPGGLYLSFHQLSRSGIKEVIVILFCFRVISCNNIQLQGSVLDLLGLFRTRFIV